MGLVWQVTTARGIRIGQHSSAESADCGATESEVRVRNNVVHWVIPEGLTRQVQL